ncbi:unnamed protein product [Amoebophrya sp. A25]|nr:unnamed protein product [Amoebophrya sp. A25]|eukprot:GSA25T00005044001.1
MWSDLFFLPRPENPAKQKIQELVRRWRNAPGKGGRKKSGSGDGIAEGSLERKEADGQGAAKQKDFMPIPSFLTYLNSPTFKEIATRMAKSKKLTLERETKAAVSSVGQPSSPTPVLYISRKYNMQSNRDYWARGLLKAGLLHARGECFLQDARDQMHPVLHRRNSVKLNWLERYRDPRYERPVDVSRSVLESVFTGRGTQAQQRFDTGEPVSGEHMMGRYNSTTIWGYKFFLAAHNTCCRHYLDEKIVKGYFHGLVPILIGPPKEDVLLVAPRGSFIHVDDFESVEYLADYLDYLNANTTAYLEYHRWRKAFDIVDYVADEFPCAFCRAVIGNEESPWAGNKKPSTSAFELRPTSNAFGSESLDCAQEALLALQEFRGNLSSTQSVASPSASFAQTQIALEKACGHLPRRRRPMEPTPRIGKRRDWLNDSQWAVMRDNDCFCQGRANSGQKRK